jgi:hypothetical protein
LTVSRGAATVLALSGLVILILSGCAHSSASRTPAPPSGIPRASASPHATSSGPVPITTSETGARGVHGTAGAIKVTVVGLSSHPGLAPGGQPLAFEVSLRNTGGSAYAHITAVISMGHCNCSHTPAEMAPAGTLQEWNPETGAWRTVSYDREGTGMDFIDQIQQPGFTLGAGTTLNMQFRIAFTVRQPVRLHRGTTAIDITVVQLPSHHPIGSGPAVSVPISVLP